MANFKVQEWVQDLEFNRWSKIACCTVICGGFVLYVIEKRRQKTKSKKKTYPKDTVIFHKLGSIPHTSSLSPFVVKLETYLRMAKIPYESVHSLELGPKGKGPWIEYNGQIIGDSQFCIEFLNQERKKDLNSHLSAEDKAIARALQKMLEENTYWTLVINRWIWSDTNILAKIIGAPSFWIKYIARPKVKNQAYSQGIGRHTDEEIYSILVGDLKAVSDFLGKKKYLFGDQPCETDCAVFGMLVIPYFQSFGSRSGDAIKGFPNLGEYCERIKATYWPDWEDLGALYDAK